MKKIISALVLIAFVFFVSSASFAQDEAAKIVKLEKEISTLNVKLVKIKNKTQRARLQKTIAGHKKVIAELKKELAAKQAAKPVKVEILKVRVVEQPQKILAVKGGLAGGAGLLAVDFLMPVGPAYLGGEAGYAIGTNFGIVDAAVKVVYSFGAPFVGLEVGYAGYSKDVKEVPGLSGTVKAGVGVGLIAGTAFGPIQVGVGYNTALGARADAGYRFYL